MFLSDGVLLRGVFESGRRDYEQLLTSGLYDKLVGRGLLIPHQEVASDGRGLPGCWKVLQPERISFISYAFEWSFSQLKDAALTVLDAQAEALAHGMILKDAPTANVQFHHGRPVLVDTLSFVRADSAAWPAYFQFCKHFVAPLLLAAYGMDRALRWSAVEADGIPLEVAAQLLPRRSWLRPLALWHVHLHSRANSSARPLAESPKGKEGNQGLARQMAIIESLRRGIDGLSWLPPDTEWSRYGDERPTYSEEAWEARLAVVRRVLAQLKPAVVWDFGMAAGHFSREAAESGALAIGFDADAASVEKAYCLARKRGETRFLPLVQDLLRPTGPGGWAEAETLSLSARGPADLLLVLGLAHHLAVPGGVPLGHQLAHFTRLGKTVLFELVPDTDQVPCGWASRFDVRGLNRAAFESSVLPLYDVIETVPLPSSERVLYLIRAR
ncbi:MAG: SAM-dependent methyltransferase [Acidobacteria bacterium]|nr:SAM-dependent methyltransferase [Acidobacteriota bacterium]